MSWQNNNPPGMCTICQCGALMHGVAFCCGKTCTSINFLLDGPVLILFYFFLGFLFFYFRRSDSSLHFELQCEFSLWCIFLKPIPSLISPVCLFVPLTVCLFSLPLCLSWRWVATQNLRLSPWAFSSPPNSSRRRLPLLPHIPSTVCPSRNRGTSSSVSQTSRTSALLSAVFTSACLSSPSRSKVGVGAHSAD